ncbi:hypothetical protein BIW11_08453 [Tropilaelaps mercedesae]|uniref:Uncharacterized protein n=1 Tax=Tropilaelaps mercedesae TaxID=418985 RepID=A0A1V9XPI6_9ACAR|nr:hypothetical protein BIW11_08453 [Tropilaelaps mercedesae]
MSFVEFQFALLLSMASIAVATHSYGFSHGIPFHQSLPHGGVISHGGDYGAPGDLLGMHSFPGYGSGLSLGGHGGHGGLSLGGHHGGLLSAAHFDSHGLALAGHGHGGLQLVDYGLPEKSKLYGGYVGGFGGYAKGALESIQHLNQGGIRLPSIPYGAPQASPAAFGSHRSLGHGAPLGSHGPIEHYGGHSGHQIGHLGIGIGGTQYGVGYKKAKAA